MSFANITSDVVFMISFTLVVVILIVLGIRKVLEHFEERREAEREPERGTTEPYGGHRDEEAGGKIGLSESDLPSVPGTPYEQKDDVGEGFEDATECPICLEKISMPVQARNSKCRLKPGAIIIPCGHSLCVYCTPYLATDSRCPICRTYAHCCVPHTAITPPPFLSETQSYTLSHPCLHLIPVSPPSDVCPICLNTVVSRVPRIPLPGLTEADLKEEEEEETDEKKRKKEKIVVAVHPAEDEFKDIRFVA
eukprot:TRINITY_DN3942_c1_g5_i1.p1 TRINITY_DN3942_c1_g5~~TRINITY_DN3942_c1_g5_i1.p1  ORF type:complete len:266 (+),score=25.35 TRINITY_DN3942_c1_g5_i1:48-800(+)